MKHNKNTDYYEKSEKNRGRIGTRECLATGEIDWLEGKDDWKGLKGIIEVKSQRTLNGKKSVEYRYYLSSLEANAETIHSAIRSHWAVENSLHWVLDMVFREDESRVRTENAVENMAIVKHAALNQLQVAKSKLKNNISIKGLRKKAGWDTTTLDTKILA